MPKIKEKIKVICPGCDGRGQILDIPDMNYPEGAGYDTCPDCKGKRFIIVSVLEMVAFGYKLYKNK